jgi:hypothetical protein
MNNSSNVISQILNNDFIPVIVVILGLFLILFINRSSISSYWMNLKTRRCLNHLGMDQITDVKCPDGLGHEFSIDRLILRQNGISILIYKKYPGKIFCADHIDEWTQMLGQKSYAFKNPLFELDFQIKALQACIPDVEVDGYLFFDHNAQFPKGHPQRVIHPQSIPQSLDRPQHIEIDQKIIQAWNNFRSHLETA